MTECKTDPRAPHGFLRNASHAEDRYVCECEFWDAPESNMVPIIRQWCMDKSGWSPSNSQCIDLLIALGVDI